MMIVRIPASAAIYLLLGCLLILSVPLLAGDVDDTSTLLCPDLVDSKLLHPNQTISCRITCLYHGSATQGSVTEFSWAVDQLLIGVGEEEDEEEESEQQEVSNQSPISLPSLPSSIEVNMSAAAEAIQSLKDTVRAVHFGSISNVSSSTDQQIIYFTYTAPIEADESRGEAQAAIRVTVDGAEISGSPIVFSVILMPTSDSSSTGLDSSPSNSSVSFFSLNNPTFLILLVVLSIVVVLVAVAVYYTARAFQRKAAALLAEEEREQQWIHNHVGNIEARLDQNNPQSPFIRLN